MTLTLEILNNTGANEEPFIIIVVVFWCILGTVLVKCVGNPSSFIISHNTFRRSESKVFAQFTKSRHVSIL
jgi:hypothetical protein